MTSPLKLSDLDLTQQEMERIYYLAKLFHCQRMFFWDLKQIT